MWYVINIAYVGRACALFRKGKYKEREGERVKGRRMRLRVEGRKARDRERE